MYIEEKITPEEMKSERFRLGLTQEDIARALNISIYTYYKWENGKSIPKRTNVVKLKALFIRTEKQLFG